MRKAFMLVGMLACLALVGGSTTTGNNERELKELTERVSKLERQAKEFEQALARLQKSLSDISKQTPSTNRELTKKMTELDKITEVLDKTSLQNSRAIATMTKELKAVAKHSDACDLLLADWFDEYHQRRSGSRYHRDQVEREK